MEKEGEAYFRKDQGLELEYHMFLMSGRRDPTLNIKLSFGCIRMVFRKEMLVRDIHVDIICK